MFPVLLMKAGLKPSLATTTAKASERVIAAPLAGVDGGWNDVRAVCVFDAKALLCKWDLREGVGACGRGPSAGVDGGWDDVRAVCVFDAKAPHLLHLTYFSSHGNFSLINT